MSEQSSNFGQNFSGSAVKSAFYMFSGTFCEKQSSIKCISVQILKEKIFRHWANRCLNCSQRQRVQMNILGKKLKKKYIFLSFFSEFRRRIFWLWAFLWQGCQRCVLRSRGIFRVKLFFEMTELTQPELANHGGKSVHTERLSCGNRLR